MGNTVPGLIASSKGVKDRETAIKAGFDPKAKGFDQFVADAEAFERRRLAGLAESERKRKETLLTGLGTTNEGNPRLG